MIESKERADRGKTAPKLVFKAILLKKRGPNMNDFIHIKVCLSLTVIGSVVLVIPFLVR